jgi:hypothetical protein
MKKLTRKLAATAVLLSLAAGSLSGCGKEDEPAAVDETPSPTAYVGRKVTVFIDGEAITGSSEVIKLGSLEAARDVLGVPLLVPSYLENNEVPLIIRKWTDGAGESVEVYYMDGYIEPSGMVTMNTPSHFILAQRNLNGKAFDFDIVGEHEIILINGYEAIWLGNEYGGDGLYWVQDGVYIQLLPSELTKEYIIKIAESLLPSE